MCDVKSDRGRMQLFVKLLQSSSLSSLSRRRDLFQRRLRVSMLLLEAAPDLTCSCNGPRPVACHTFNAFQFITHTCSATHFLPAGSVQGLAFSKLLRSFSGVPTKYGFRYSHFIQFTQCAWDRLRLSVLDMVLPPEHETYFSTSGILCIFPNA